MKDEIIKRIEVVVFLSRLSVRAFSHKIDVPEQTLYKCINGRMPAVELLQKILIAHPDISAEWLLMGEGDMKKTDAIFLKQQIKEKDEQIRLLIGKIIV